MNIISLHTPIERLTRSPELAVISILETALNSCKIALLAANPDLAYGDIADLTRGSSSLKANAVLIASRRLAEALAAYRDALDREERRRGRMPF